MVTRANLAKRSPMTETVAFRLANQLKRDLQSAQAIAHAAALRAENMDDVPRALAIHACSIRPPGLQGPNRLYALLFSITRAP
jgi:hypothetical protein